MVLVPLLLDIGRNWVAPEVTIAWEFFREYNINDRYYESLFRKQDSH